MRRTATPQAEEWWRQRTTSPHRNFTSNKSGYECQKSVYVKSNVFDELIVQTIYIRHDGVWYASKVNLEHLMSAHLKKSL